MTLVLTPPPEPPEVDLQTTYDAIVVGSGAAGGMAAHVLTSQGLKVLLLEAGKKLDIETELRSMEWPYDHPRRGDAPPGWHALSLNEYNDPQAALRREGQRVQARLLVRRRLGRLGLRQEHPRRREGASRTRGRTTPGCARACSAARPTSGAGSRCGSPTTTSRRRRTTATARTGRSPTPTSSRTTTGSTATSASPATRKDLPHLPDSLFQRPNRLNAAEVKLRNALKTMGRVATPYRAGVTTDGLKHNKYRSKCFGRGACQRRAGGCDIHAAFDSPTGLIYPAMDTGNLTLRTNSTAHEVLVDPKTGRARGVAFVDSVTHKSLRGEGARSSWSARRTLESARLLLLSKSPQHPNGIGNSSGHVGHNFCEHVMGPGVTGLVKELVGKPRTHRRRPPGRLLHAALPQPDRQAERLHPRLRLRGQQRASRCSPTAPTAPGFGKQYKKEVRDYAGAFISMGGFGEVLPRYENAVSIDPEREGRVGDPRPALRLQVRRQREEDGRGHGHHRQGDVRGGGDRGHRRRSRDPHRRLVDPRARARRAWAPIRRRRCSTSSSSRTT